MQIQRIQTLFLFFAVCCMGAFCFLDRSDNAGVLTVSITAAVVTLIDIFMYHNLKSQMRVAQVSMLLTLAAGVASVVATIEAGVCAFVALPVVAFVLQILALRGMKHDNRLLRSQDRLR